MKAGGDAFFKEALFEGPVNFNMAEILGIFDAERAKFQNKETDVSFYSMKVGRGAFFNGAVFEGSADFGSADITSNFEAQEAKFQNKEKRANFNGMKVGDILFSKVVFEGPVYLVGANTVGGTCCE
jgi:uncharacterized protein YjbI with pentapeptide repeats